jgi:hypothetical protein
MAPDLLLAPYLHQATYMRQEPNQNCLMVETGPEPRFQAHLLE